MAENDKKECSVMPDPPQDYRQHLVLAEQKSQEAYDKTVLALSGGALGVSFVFVEKFLSNDEVCSPALLIFAWICWVLSLAAVLASHLFSQLALRRAIKQVDKKQYDNQTIGGCYSKITTWCNYAGGILFIVGLISMIIFATCNIGGISDMADNNSSQTPSNPPQQPEKKEAGYIPPPPPPPDPGKRVEEGYIPPPPPPPPPKDRE